jgi:ABC-2 type transport system permease protein
VRFREVFRYEIEYRLRSLSTGAYGAFLFLIMCWGLFATTGDDPVNLNGPQNVAEGTVLWGGMFGVLVSAALFGDAAIRDVAAGMDPLLYTTRLRKVEYLGGRFLAALAINAVLVLAIPLGFWISTLAFFDASALGPHRLAAYVHPLVLFLWPNLILVGAFQFTIGTLTGHVIPVYLGTASIFIGSLVAANYWNDIESLWLSALADPIGINALLAMTRYWTPAELETRLIGFPTMLVWNRVLWLVIAAGMLVALHRRFRFAHGDGVGRARRQTTVDAPARGRWHGTVPRVPGVFSRSTRVRQTIAIARHSVAEVVSGRGFQVGFVVTIGLVLLWGWNVGNTLFETSTWPVTHLVVGEVLSRRAPFIPWVVIALYAGELVWKHRELGTAEIVDAAPVPTGIALAGRFLALVTIIVGFQTALMIGGVLLQALQGYYNFELGLYVRVLFGLNLVEHVLLATLAMTVHVLVNQKYVGHILVLMASAFQIGGPMSGIHRMLVYNSDPGWTYSDMNGFGPFVEPFVWFKAYWASWALLFAVITIMFWVRGTELGVRHRLTLARARFCPSTARMAGVAIALIAVLGGFIFYNINVLNEYRGRDEAGLPQAEYERRYARFLDAPQPVITAADLRFEIYPDEPAVDMRGSYQLVNRSGVAIDSVHVVINRDVDARSLSLDRATRNVVVDEETGYRTLALEQALQPGDSLRLSFDVAFRPRGFRGTSAIQTDVVRNGTYFDRRLLPFVGYQPVFELSDAAARKRFGLAPRPPMPSPDNVEAREVEEIVRNEDGVHLEMIVGTASDQIAIVSAPLRRSWTENSRRYFHYGTDVADKLSASVFSAKYEVVEDRWRNVRLQIFHHPGHRQTLDRMIESMKASLDYFTSMFGPYQFRELRIAEIPPYSLSGGRAHATTIAFGEQFFITRVKEGGGDMTFFGTAHEVAHSWWGAQLRGAYARGRAVLSETLSNYSAMMVTEKILGPQEARRVYDFQMDRYLSRRAAFQSDVPLTEVEDHPHIAYGKGAVAMYTLREHIGEKAVKTALRRLLEKHRNSGPPYPTSLDLIRELRAVTPDSLRYLVTDLFETVTLWDVKTERAVAARTAGGQYELTLDVIARKMRADSVGHETDTPMDDLVEIGVFGQGTVESLGVPLYLQRHRIRSGKQAIRITVPGDPAGGGPARAGIDPSSKLIDRERKDNVVDVKIQNGSAL